jgi:hypothetical protein
MAYIREDKGFGIGIIEYEEHEKKLQAALIRRGEALTELRRLYYVNGEAILESCEDCKKMVKQYPTKS